MWKTIEEFSKFAYPKLHTLPYWKRKDVFAKAWLMYCTLNNISK